MAVPIGQSTSNRAGAGAARHSRIPFNRPSLVGNELQYLATAISNDHTSSGGPFTKLVAAELAAAHGAADVLLTTSCTDALEMAALLLDLGPGDVVIVPSFTFVSTALAFARTGARLRFADIDRDTLGLCPESVRALLDSSVRAVVPVHYAGIGCDMDGLADVLADRPIAVVEDNAHGLFGKIDDRPLGSLGRLSTLSFHETKNFVCGEGGALVLNDERDVDRAHILLNKGTNRRQFMQGQVDKYTWVDSGSSFGLSDLLAAYLLAQLEQREHILERRSRLWWSYDAILKPLEGHFGYSCMNIPAGRTCAWHMYYVLMPDQSTRDGVIADLAKEGINATFHYVPLHSSPGGKRFTNEDSACGTTDDVSARLIRLPFYNELSSDEVDRICGAIVASLDRQLN